MTSFFFKETLYASTPTFSYRQHTFYYRAYARQRLRRHTVRFAPSSSLFNRDVRRRAHVRALAVCSEEEPTTTATTIRRRRWQQQNRNTLFISNGLLYIDFFPFYICSMYIYLFLDAYFQEFFLSIFLKAKFHVSVN